MNISVSLPSELSSESSQSSDADGDNPVSGSGSSSGGEMQTDIDRHVDAEAGGAPMNAALTSMYGSASQRGAVIAEGQSVNPPATDAAPAVEIPAERVAAELLPELPPAFAPVHLVAAAAARALAAERGQRPQTKPRPAQQSCSAATVPAVSETAVGLQAMDLSPQPDGDAPPELDDPQTPAARQAGAVSTSGAATRPAGTPGAGNKVVNNKKLRRRKSTEPGCAPCHHHPQDLGEDIWHSVGVGAIAETGCMLNARL